MSKVDKSHAFAPPADLKLDNQVCFPLYAAANAVVRAYYPYLSELGLTYPQFLVLMVLWEEDGVSIGEIGRRLHLETGTLTPVLKRMEAAGLVARRRSESDERRVCVSLTPSGKALRDKARDVPTRMMERFDLKQENALLLKDLLTDLVNRIDAG